MRDITSFSCYLIGEDDLVIQCGDILLSQGHRILGIISPNSQIQDWALDYNITYFNSLSSAENSLASTEFDYLFSIVNSYILTPTILSYAKKLAINYHNGPLPRYAGVHAPAWAILNEEKTHGVTWHVLSHIVDGGDILKQSIIQIDEHETGLSLSVKCYQHALDSFAELLSDLTLNKLKLCSQDLSKRLYYGFNDKAHGNGWISWNDSAENIEKIFRALHLGHYHPNRFGVVKFSIRDQFFFPEKITLLNNTSNLKPGTIIAINNDSIEIATQTKNLLLEQLINFDGQICNISFIVDSFKLKPGDKLNSPTQQDQHTYKILSSDIAKHEQFWANELHNYLPASIPFLPLVQLENNNCTFKHIASFHITNKQLENFKKKFNLPEKIENIFLALLTIYLYRIGNTENLGFALSCPTNFSPLLSNWVPFSVKLTDDMRFNDILNIIKEHQECLEQHVTYLHDMIYRYPDLTQELLHQQSIAIIIKSKKGKVNFKYIPMNIIVVISPTDNKLQWYIDNRLFSSEKNLSIFIKNSCVHLKKLFESILNHDCEISKALLLGNSEQQKIIKKWNKTKNKYPKEKTIAQLFEKQVQLTPKKIALRYNELKTSYNELNIYANQLANFLRKAGLKPGKYCIISTENTFYFIVSILAILKLGSAYIPIDPDYPQHHIQAIIQNSRPSLILCSEKIREKITSSAQTLEINAYVYFIDKLMKSLSNEDIKNISIPHTKSTDIAYAMYTSGTTGKPKGVMISNKSIARLVKNTNYIKIQAKDKITQAASVSFDAATFEIWGALLNGAELIAIPHNTVLNILEFEKFIKKNKITILWLTSGLFNQYAAINPGMFKNLTYLLVGGDVLNLERIMSVIECSLGAPKYILNGYGPTENTTFTTTHRISIKDKSLPTIPIGKPISNTTVYVLDKYLQPTPIGVIGELYTGGDGIALGYLNLPEMTQKKFIKNPFNPTERLYKTGDSVRWLPDGKLEYIGREDNQIKIRGYRVELEAIQSQLLHHPNISQCVVRPYEDNKHNKVLVAYLVSSEKINKIDLNAYLIHHLPIYMVPNFYIFLEKFPLTSNGKINYKKLPIPNLTERNLNVEYVEPKTATEIKLLAIWQKLFSLEKIGVFDKFFDLGGHSLLITKLILEIKKIFGFDVPLHDFLEIPTIEHLAKLINDPKNQNIEKNNLLIEDSKLTIPIKLTAKSKFSTFSNHIFLTGATGFLGAHLLKDFRLLHPNALIYCLVRSNNKNEAIDRLNSAFKKYKLNLSCDNHIIPIPGDLSQQCLGLNENYFLKLSEKIDCIYHNGAFVHHLYNYESLRSTNVLSTLEILKLATLKKPKTIHYISTLSAVGGYTDTKNLIIEDFISESDNSLPLDGYSQSKWAAEKILSQAYHAGVPIKIYRPAWILGQKMTGIVSAEKNHLLMLIKGCIQMKCAPNWNMHLDILPVDFISEAIAKISQSSEIKEKVFNLSNPHTISWLDLINYLNKRGYNILIVNSNEWKNLYLKNIKEDNALFSLLTLYMDSMESDWMKRLENVTSSHNKNSNIAFKKLNLIPPEINNKLLDLYFNFLDQEGFITLTKQSEKLLF